MDGFLDELNQAWLNLDFGQGRADFLIDTGFAGTLIIGEESFDASRAIPAGYVDSTLAAGQSYRYQRFDLSLEWLGVSMRLFVLVGPKDVNRLRVEPLTTRGIHVSQGFAEHIVV